MAKFLGMVLTKKKESYYLTNKVLTFGIHPAPKKTFFYGVSFILSGRHMAGTGKTVETCIKEIEKLLVDDYRKQLGKVQEVSDYLTKKGLI